MGIGNALAVWLAKEATGRRAMSHPHARFSADWYGGRRGVYVQVDGGRQRGREGGAFHLLRSDYRRVASVLEFCEVLGNH